MHVTEGGGSVALEVPTGTRDGVTPEVDAGMGVGTLAWARRVASPKSRLPVSRTRRVRWPQVCLVLIRIRPSASFHPCHCRNVYGGRRLCILRVEETALRPWAPPGQGCARW